MSDDWVRALAVIHVVGFWVLLFWVIQLRRQVRCLQFCFVGISDWAIDKLRQVRDDYIADRGRHQTPFTLLEVEKEWGEKIKFFLGMLKRVRVRFRRTTTFTPSIRELASNVRFWG
jgi:hypothetical protein